jgi:polysaccharide biosynthesis/export protein
VLLDFRPPLALILLLFGSNTIRASQARISLPRAFRPATAVAERRQAQGPWELEGNRMNNVRPSALNLGTLLVFCMALAAVPTELRADNQQVPAPRQTESPGYVIQPNDILEIFVWKEPDLSRKVLVRPDGRISFPLVQDLTASGLTPSELREKIQTELAHYLQSPNVTVIVDAIRHYKIYVVGKVQNPGSFIIEKPISVLQALTLAGGFQQFANETGVTIIRSSEGNRHVVFDFNYRDVVRGRGSNQNIRLQSGDVVVVP